LCYIRNISEAFDTIQACLCVYVNFLFLSQVTTLLLIVGMDLNNIVMVGRMDQLISHSAQFSQEEAILTISMLLVKEEHYGGMHTFYG